MKTMGRIAVFLFVSIMLTACASKGPSTASLDLWNDGAPKAAITDFVQSVTDTSSPDFLQPGERIATFDMDGTILLEKPSYANFDFALGLLKKQMAADPSLTDKPLYKAVAENNMEFFHGNWYGPGGLYDVLLYATDGMTDAEYRMALEGYLAQPHPRFGRSPNELLFAPVLQLIDYLKTNGFKVYIVSGSDPEFTRIAAAENVGLPPEDIVGTTVLTEWDGEKFTRQHEFVKPINDEAGKPVNIRNKIGRVPVMVVGNSGGDLDMLNYSKTAGHSLQLVVNHDDPEREYEYSVEKIKKLCAENNWIEISMKNDFKIVFDQP